MVFIVFCTWRVLEPALCLQQTGVHFIQVKLTKISYIGTLFKVKLYRILVYSGFGLDDCICKILYFYILHNLYFSSNFDGFFSMTGLWQVLDVVIQHISSISDGLRVDCSNISTIQDDESIVDWLLSYHTVTYIAHYFVLQNIITKYHKYLIKLFSPCELLVYYSSVFVPC